MTPKLRNPDVTAVANVVEHFAREATQFRFVLIYENDVTIEADTLDEFNATATMMALQGHAPIAGYFGFPCRPKIGLKALAATEQARPGVVEQFALSARRVTGR